MSKICEDLEFHYYDLQGEEEKITDEINDIDQAVESADVQMSDC